MNNQEIPVIEIATESSVRLSETKQRRFYVSDKPRDPNKPYVAARFQRKVEPETKIQMFMRWLKRQWWRFTHRNQEGKIRETRYYIVEKAQQRAKEAIQQEEDRKIFAMLNNEL